VDIELEAIEGPVLFRGGLAKDERGSFGRIYCHDALSAAGIEFTPCQASLSRNGAARTLRGLHFQSGRHAEAKIVVCVRGRIWDVVVDLRPSSPTFEAWSGIELAADTPAARYVPAGFAHGFLTMEGDSDLLYLIDTPYEPGAAEGIRWNDPDLAIDWPARPALVSRKDAALPALAEVRRHLAPNG